MPSEMAALRTADDVRELLYERPARTRTYRVDRETLRALPSDDPPEMRTMDDTEVAELAEHLGVRTDDLDGPFRVVELRCPECDRHTTFLDFVATAEQHGAHELVQLRGVLTGRAGAWLTIRGRDGGRPVDCLGCGTTLRPREGYSEYSSSSYAYA